MNPDNKPLIGITCGDLNGIGLELIIKTFSDNRVLEQCTPIIFASNITANPWPKPILIFKILKTIADSTINR